MGEGSSYLDSQVNHLFSESLGEVQLADISDALLRCIGNSPAAGLGDVVVGSSVDEESLSFKAHLIQVLLLGVFPKSSMEEITSVLKRLAIFLHYSPRVTAACQRVNVIQILMHLVLNVKRERSSDSEDFVDSALTVCSSWIL